MNPKNSKKSLIHENADANITCDFGDGDISRSRSFLSNTYRRERPRPHARTRQSRELLKFISRCLRFVGRAVWAVQESTNDNYTDIMLKYIFHIECNDNALINIKKVPTDANVIYHQRPTAVIKEDS